MILIWDWVTKVKLPYHFFFKFQTPWKAIYKQYATFEQDKCTKAAMTIFYFSIVMNKRIRMGLLGLPLYGFCKTVINKNSNSNLVLSLLSESWPSVR